MEAARKPSPVRAVGPHGEDVESVREDEALPARRPVWVEVRAAQERMDAELRDRSKLRPRPTRHPQASRSVRRPARKGDRRAIRRPGGSIGFRDAVCHGCLSGPVGCHHEDVSGASRRRKGDPRLACGTRARGGRQGGQGDRGDTERPSLSRSAPDPHESLPRPPSLGLHSLRRRESRLREGRRRSLCPIRIANALRRT